MQDNYSEKSFFHFRIFTNGSQKQESEPLDFADKSDVWEEGADASCEIIRGMMGKIEPGFDWRLEISDDTGKVIYRFSFKAEKLSA